MTWNASGKGNRKEALEQIEDQIKGKDKEHAGLRNAIEAAMDTVKGKDFTVNANGDEQSFVLNVTATGVEEDEDRKGKASRRDP